MDYLNKIALLACRIISVYILAKWLGAFCSSIVTLIYYQGETQFILSGIVSMALPLVIGILIWVLSTKLADYMVKPVEDRETGMTSLTFDLDTVQVIVFTATGLILIVSAVPSLISALIVCAVLPEAIMGNIWFETLGQIVDAAIRIILGLWLVFGGRGLVALIKKVRTIGVK